MSPGSFRFDRFRLDPADRQLTCDGAPVALNSRYLDALVLLVREPGKLVSKDAFLTEVWRGVPVTDEALTQCIKTLRRSLGDDAAQPRFIETVPKHGYRFIAPVEPAAPEPAGALPSARPAIWPNALRVTAAGALGGAAAGVLGGLVYGFATQPPGMGAASALLVLICLTALVGLLGGAGVSGGVAAAGLLAARHSPWTIAGGALGGLVVGALAKLIGLDAFALLFGRSPGDITGGPEGALIGAAVGLAAWLAGRRAAAPALALAALIGAAAGLLIALSGGRLMGGSLDLLARQFSDSRLSLIPLATLFGEPVFGPVSRAATAALESALFCAGAVGAMILAKRR